MNSISWLQKTIQDSIDVKQILLSDSNFSLELVKLINEIEQAYRRGNKVIFAGNGGSAADAQHFAAEFVSRFAFDRPGLPSLSLTTDTSMLTAISNDYGYEKLFKRQLEAQAREGDIFIGLTTSGKSKNILEAFRACPDLGVTAAALCGIGGSLEGVVDYLIRVPSDSTPRIQECHVLIGHMICGEVERRIFLNPRNNHE
jgi:D-sedoheptulose 7-phosphate isomerase